MFKGKGFQDFAQISEHIIFHFNDVSVFPGIYAKLDEISPWESEDDRLFQ
jgi:hypothetical protein